MTGGWVIAMVAGALAGGVVTHLMTSVGLRQVENHLRPRLAACVALAGGVVGAAAVSIAYRADQGALVPALVIWGSALVALAVGDAVTQRVPTALVRQTTVATAVLLVLGLGVHRDWNTLALSGVAAFAAGATMLACWRFAGAGFGDVRLAILGGLGLGHATGRGLLLGLAGVVVVLLVQAGMALALGGQRNTQIALGSALTIGFVVAAAT